MLTTIVETSPANGEGNVAVTRETILRFFRPLAEDAVVYENVVFAHGCVLHSSVIISRI